MHVVDRTHPITQGMREYVWTFNDDMLTNLKWDPAVKINVLVTGFDDPSLYAPKFAGPKYPPQYYPPAKLAEMTGMGKENPLVWTAQYGKGRIYCITVGHGPDTLQYAGVTTLITRGTEWAASGKVTVPVLDDAKTFPAEAATLSPYRSSLKHRVGIFRGLGNRLIDVPVLGDLTVLKPEDFDHRGTRPLGIDTTPVVNRGKISIDQDVFNHE